MLQLYKVYYITLETTLISQANTPFVAKLISFEYILAAMCTKAKSCIVLCIIYLFITDSAVPVKGKMTVSTRNLYSVFIPWCFQELRIKFSRLRFQILSIDTLNYSFK